MLNIDTLPIRCRTPVEREICIESWRFFKNPALSSVQNILTRSDDILQDLYKTAIMLQGANAALDDDITFITSHLANNGHKIPCSCGCSACCKQAIVATPFEATLIGIYLTNNNTIHDIFLDNYTQWQAATENIREEFMDWAHQYYSKNVDDGRFKYTDFHTPCPFLVDNLCQIYPVRPYCCRSYLATTEYCQSPETPNERPGFRGMDVGRYTDFKQNNTQFMDLMWQFFGIDQKKTTARLLPDLVYRFLNGETDSLLNYCQFTN